MITTTGNEVAGHSITGYLGVVRGIVVRSPTIAQGIFGGLKTIIGGNNCKGWSNWHGRKRRRGRTTGFSEPNSGSK